MCSWAGGTDICKDSRVRAWLNAWYSFHSKSRWVSLFSKINDKIKYQGWVQFWRERLVPPTIKSIDYNSVTRHTWEEEQGDTSSDQPSRHIQAMHNKPCQWTGEGWQLLNYMQEKSTEIFSHTKINLVWIR